MESSQSYYRCWASNEQTDALRSITPLAREYSKMAVDSSERAVAADASMPLPFVTRVAFSA